MNGLKNSHFSFYLQTRHLKDIAKLLTRAKKYINVEEAMSARKEANKDRARKSIRVMMRGDPRKIQVRSPGMKNRPLDNPQVHLEGLRGIILLTPRELKS